jgi:hypothetical protein
LHNLTAAVQPVALETNGGLVTLARPENVPEGASPRNYDMDYLIGSAQTRAPLENVYSFANAGSGPNSGNKAAGTDWGNPGNILLDDGNYAISTASNPNPLFVIEFAFNLPATATPTGVEVNLKGFSTSPMMATAQLLFEGVPVGVPKTLALPTSPGTITFGGFSDNWGTDLTQAAVNGTAFGVSITVSGSFSFAQALLDFVSIQLGQTTSNANFDFITTFVAQDGSVKNLSLDADGNFWVEDVTNNPNVLTLAFDGVAPNSFASAVNGPGVEYVAFNDLTTGSDVPRQYTPNWTDRISQVGPGAPPSFIASNNTAGAVAITAFSITSNVVTLTAANSFTAGELVGITGMGVATFLNGLSFTVLGTGLSSTQFQVAFTNANVSTTGDSGTATPQTAYPITSITQPAPGFPGQVGFFDGIELSSGPGSSSAGNVVTIYTANARAGHFPGGDPVLTAAFNSGQPVYIFVSGAPFGNGTQLVTSIGLATPNFAGATGERWYLTFTVPSSGFQTEGGSDAAVTGQYQITVATLTTGSPIPGAQVGNQISIVDASIPAWNQTWTLTQTLNSGAMAITQTEASGNVATYSYSVNSGAPPAAGDLVTVTNTLNGNGAFNVTDAVIASASGGTSGTFTVNGFGADQPATVEEGQATTAGTQFQFDPGLTTLGTANSPIFGNATGGQATLVGGGTIPIGSGTRQAVVFFITRNGYFTAPSPPVTFTTPDNTTSILVSNIPIGPPNVIARGIAFTEAGQNGVPGANFFYIPQNVITTVFGVSTTATATVIFDNTSTTATFTFTDDVLLNATAIDIQGFNLFNLIELGNPGWIVSYDSRNFYGLCQNKIQNFLNLSFDGGFLATSGATAPLGWSAQQSTTPGVLLVSPIFGNSYFISNTTGAQATTLGQIYQSAYQDAYQVPILNANTAYSVRVTARIPSGVTQGNLVIDLVDLNQGTGFGTVYGTYLLPFNSMTTSMATFAGTLLLNEFETVPAGLVLRIYAQNIGAGADVEIDRFDVFPTEIPVLATTVFGSYADLLESVDAITGPVNFTSENQQPVNGAVVMFDTFYGLKQTSMYSLQASPNLEPAQWNEPEVAQRAGACGVNAYDFGEQWIVEACRNGLYLFEGGQPGKIMQEIYQIWDAINWDAGKSIWVKNDVPGRRLFIGVPLPTPNFWLPNAPLNNTPTTPNVILMMNYQGCDTGEAIKTSMQLHETMFGSLNAVDMRRKWSIWQIASPYANVVSTRGTEKVFQTGPVNLLNSEIRFCNGIASSKIYRLNTDLAPDEVPTDDGATINSLYTTYGYVNLSKASQMPLLGLFRKLWKYMTHQISGTGLLNVRLLPNTLLGVTSASPFFDGQVDSTAGYYPWTLPGGFVLTDPCTQVREAPLNFAATRTFVEFSTTGRMNISNLVMTGSKHPHNQLTGQR